MIVYLLSTSLPLLLHSPSSSPFCWPFLASDMPGFNATSLDDDLHDLNVKISRSWEFSHVFQIFCKSYFETCISSATKVCLVCVVMQAGFMLLEAGAVRWQNRHHVLLVGGFRFYIFVFLCLMTPPISSSLNYRKTSSTVAWQ